MVQDEHQSGKAPLSAHPAFPAIVGLWFAALLGLGTIVMPAVVLETIASATGLAAVFPATEAPLSATGRAAFALLATILGLVGGLVLARRVARAQDFARPTRRRTPTGRAAPPRPLSVHDDLGEDAIAPPAAVTGQAPTRRRALAVTEETAPSDYLMAAPLPGEPEIPELPEDEMSERPNAFEEPTLIEAETDELDLGTLTPSAETQVFQPEEASAEDPAEDFVMPAYVPELDTRKPRAVTAPSATEPAEEPAAAKAPEPTDPFTAPITAAPIDRPLEDLGMVQLAERLGRSLQQRLADRDAETQAEAEPIAFSAPSLDHHEADAVAVPPPVVPDALRAFMDAAQEDFAPSAAPSEPEAEPEAEVQVPPPVVPPALMPFAFQPFDTDEEEDDLDPGTFTLPLSTMAPRPFDTPAVAQPAPADTVDVEESDEDDDEDLALDENYSSLLEMSNPFRQREEFVRIDEPEAEDGDIEPAVVFPADEAPAPQPEALDEDTDEDDTDGADLPFGFNPERPFDAPQLQPAPNTAPVRPRPVRDAAETERALRAALANLQRMSGAA